MGEEPKSIDQLLIDVVASKYPDRVLYSEIRSYVEGFHPDLNNRKLVDKVIELVGSKKLDGASHAFGVIAEGSDYSLTEDFAEELGLYQE